MKVLDWIGMWRLPWTMRRFAPAIASFQGDLISKIPYQGRLIEDSTRTFRYKTGPCPRTVVTSDSKLGSFRDWFILLQVRGQMPAEVPAERAAVGSFLASVGCQQPHLFLAHAALLQSLILIFTGRLWLLRSTPPILVSSLRAILYYK